MKAPPSRGVDERLVESISRFLMSRSVEFSLFVRAWSKQQDPHLR